MTKIVSSFYNGEDLTYVLAKVIHELLGMSIQIDKELRGNPLLDWSKSFHWARTEFLMSDPSAISPRVAIWHEGQAPPETTPIASGISRSIDVIAKRSPQFIQHDHPGPIDSHDISTVIQLAGKLTDLSE